jgi:uncharacterized protein (DUF302 family)
MQRAAAQRRRNERRNDMSRNVQFSRNVGLAIALIGVLGLGGSALAATPAGPGVQVAVNGSVDDAVSQLKKMVGDGGMMVMGELHQGKVLSMTGINVSSETLFVGSPTVGKKLFSAQPGVGLVVPVRVNVYATAQGQTVVSYIPPSQQLAAFHDANVDMIAKMLDEKLQKMVGMLGK